jgi:hypothetical protein
LSISIQESRLETMIVWLMSGSFSLSSKENMSIADLLYLSFEESLSTYQETILHLILHLPINDKVLKDIL